MTPRLVLCLALGAAACGGQADTKRAPPPSPAASDEPAEAAAPSESVPPVLSDEEQRQPCSENPLIGPCPGTQEPESVRSQVRRFEAILDMSCGSCHGSLERTRCAEAVTRGGECPPFSYIDDIEQLIAKGKVLPCRWEESPLARRIQDGSMPPAAAGFSPLSATNEDALQSFVNGICPSLTDGGPDDTDRQTVESLLANHCEQCHGEPPASSPAPGGLARVTDIGALIEGGFLLPCNSEGSPIVRALRDASMPPPGGTEARPNAADIEALADFIDRPCRRF